MITNTAVKISGVLFFSSSLSPYGELHNLVEPQSKILLVKSAV
ncbi:hypothetical protein [Avibacterium paragallinarum]|nr:hypothetical protein [Avibacterium paragallinarum]